MEYCPYELAAEQMKDLMGDSANSHNNAKLLSIPTREFTNEEWQQFCDKEDESVYSSDKVSEQKENQIDYHVECNPTYFNNAETSNEIRNSSSVQQSTPKNSTRLMLSDFPDLNSEKDESDSFKDFLQLEAEMLKGSPSPVNSIKRRLDSLQSDKDENDVQSENRVDIW